MSVPAVGLINVMGATIVTILIKYILKINIFLMSEVILGIMG